MRKLYNDLLKVVEESDRLFFFVDQKTPDGKSMRIFDYHMAGYHSWIKPGAMACRGIMFEMNGGTPVRIAARPMDKFFNWQELVGWANADLPVHGNMRLVNNESKIRYVMDKRDGSLISTYQDETCIRCKSKGSLHSEQALAATTLLHQDRELYKLVEWYTLHGYTVNMEYTAPDNQIVIAYQKPELRFLNARHNETGEYMFLGSSYSVDMFTVPDDVETWAARAFSEVGKEGYVVVLEDGQMVKIKTDWYVNLHHTKDSVNNARRLAMCVLNNQTDDLLQLFKDDPGSIAKINRFNEFFLEQIGEWTASLHEVWAEHQGKDRRDFAILLQSVYKGKEESKFLFSQAMEVYKAGGTTGMVDRMVDALKSKDYLTWMVVPTEYRREDMI